MSSYGSYHSWGGASSAQWGSQQPFCPIDPYFKASNLYLSHIEIGVGFITFWGLGDVTRSLTGSEVLFREWFSQIYPRLPPDVRLMQGDYDKLGNAPKDYRNIEFMHPKSHEEPKDLNHFHLLYPHKDITGADTFQLRLLLNNLGWVNPIIFKDFIQDNVKMRDQLAMYSFLEMHWLEATKDIGNTP